MTTLFVTGSGTGVGKTFVCCRLLETLPAGTAVRCVKPIVTGFDPEAPAETDTGRLLTARGLPIDAAGIDATSPWRFRDPVSADMAQARERLRVPFEELVAFSRPPPGVALNIVEGIGGVMAPIDSRRTVLDWIEALEAKVLLVTGSYLGTLSHTLTAVDALRGRNITIIAIVLSQSPDEPAPTAETAASLGRFTGDLPIAVLPRIDSADVAELATLLGRRFDLA